eukprot:TRINITY_DN10750_c0_g1_i7.p1 TRINITY_DN10750_c0_g1~~TRINITY_DN10750_c0_g1_i7.p1  ORF type:complete len:287 (+),score=9.97 TRINITY_DN10750_c0_g1_i7:85-861(+)
MKKKRDTIWRHKACDKKIEKFLPSKVHCMVCGKVGEEKNFRIRSSGFKCDACVGKPKKETSFTLTPIKPASPSASPSASPMKDFKMGSSGYSLPMGYVHGSPPPMYSPQGVSPCVNCGLTLQVAPGQTLITCPSCQTVMNPTDRDQRFLQCATCKSLLQYSASKAVGSDPIIACGRCHTPNHLPSTLRKTQAQPVRVPASPMSQGSGLPSPSQSQGQGLGLSYTPVASTSSVSISSISQIGRAVQQECRDRSRMPSSA